MLTNTLFTTIALCAAAVVAVDPPTTQIFLAGFDQQNLVGSVIASDSTATTFSVACASTADSKCEVPADFTFTQGPSTIHYAYTHSAQSSDDFSGTIDVGCMVTVDHGTCSKSVNAVLGTITSAATSSTTTFSAASEMGAQMLTVTAGNLVTPTTASSTSSSSSSVSSKSTSSSSSSVSSSSSSSSHSSTITSTPKPIHTSSPVNGPTFVIPVVESVSSSKVSTGGLPMITGNAQWVIGGAAAVVVLAAL